MAPATGTAILLLVAFVLPGFVALRYGELTYRTKAEDTPFERLLNALYYSFLTYALIFAASCCSASTPVTSATSIVGGAASAATSRLQQVDSSCPC